jgi:hypothetical protein
MSICNRGNNNFVCSDSVSSSFEEVTFLAYDSNDQLFAHGETIEELKKSIKTFGKVAKRKERITTSFSSYGKTKYNSEEI